MANKELDIYIENNNQYIAEKIEKKLINGSETGDDDFEGESFADYEKRWNALRASFKDVKAKMEASQKNNANTMTPEQQEKFASMVERFNTAYERFMTELKKPSDIPRKKAISLGNIAPNSSWSDVGLTMSEISNIDVTRYIGSSTSCEYYLVKAKGQEWILRIKPETRFWGYEVALAPKPEGKVTAKVLQSYITLGEQTNAFSDIEISGSRGINSFGLNKDFTTEDAKSSGLSDKLQTAKSYVK